MYCSCMLSNSIECKTQRLKYQICILGILYRDGKSQGPVRLTLQKELSRCEAGDRGLEHP